MPDAYNLLVVADAFHATDAIDSLEQTIRYVKSADVDDDLRIHICDLSKFLHKHVPQKKSKEGGAVKLDIDLRNQLIQFIRTNSCGSPCKQHRQRNINIIILPPRLAVTGTSSFLLDFADGVIFFGTSFKFSQVSLLYLMSKFLKIPRFVYLNNEEDRVHKIQIGVQTLLISNKGKKSELQQWLVSHISQKSGKISHRGSIKVSRLVDGVLVEPYVLRVSFNDIGDLGLTYKTANNNIVDSNIATDVVVYQIHANNVNHSEDAKHRPVLIFFPGITARYVAYLPILRQLSEHFRVFSLDMPLHGLSSRSFELGDVEMFRRIVTIALKKVVEEYAYGQTMSEKFANSYVMGHSLGAGMLVDAVSRLEDEYKIKFGKLFAYSPIGFRVSHDKWRLFWIGNKLKIKHWKSYYKFTKYVKKGIVDGFINLYQNYNGSFKRSPMFRLYLQLEKGIPRFEKNIIKSPSVIAFADKDHYFDVDYRLRFVSLFKEAVYTEIAGLHDWPVIKPNTAVQLVYKYIMHGSK